MTDTTVPIRNIEIRHEHFKGDVTTQYLEHPVTLEDRRRVGVVSSIAILPVEFRIPMSSLEQRPYALDEIRHCVVPYKYTKATALYETTDGGLNVTGCVLDEKGLRFYTIAKIIAKDLFQSRTEINMKAIRELYMGVEVWHKDSEPTPYVATGWKVLTNIHALPAGFSRNVRQYLVDWLWQIETGRPRVAPGELEIPGEERSWTYDLSFRTKASTKDTRLVSSLVSDRWLTKTVIDGDAQTICFKSRVK